MKYIILADSDNVEPFTEPRQLTKINGETLVGRTIRLLKEKGIEEVLITSHDNRFDNLGATRYEPKYNDWKPKENKGYWLSAFPIELLNEPVTFLLGDVYYSKDAIKTIVNSKTDYILFYCTSRKCGYSDKYVKHHDEPLGFKIENWTAFKKGIEDVKKLKDIGKTRREPIMWELYRYLNNIDINVHELKENYIPINDETCDIDTEEDVIKLQFKIGGIKMVRVQVKEFFTLRKFNELKEIVRADPMKNKDGELYVDDTFLCSEEMAKYLMNEIQNPSNRSFIKKVIEVIPDEKPVKKTTRKRKKKEE